MSRANANEESRLFELLIVNLSRLFNTQINQTFQDSPNSYANQLEAVGFPEEDIPSRFKDPISGGIITTAVCVRQNGHMFFFDKDTITHWLREHATNPITRGPLKLSDIKEAQLLQEEIDTFVERTLTNKKHPTP